jgi:hypothetical protein
MGLVIKSLHGRYGGQSGSRGVRELTEDRRRTFNWGPLANAWSVGSSIIGAIGLLNITQGMLELKNGLRQLVDAWQAVVSPVARFLFGWIRIELNVDLPLWFEDYLAIGVIVGFSIVRAVLIAVADLNKRHAVMKGWRREASAAWVEFLDHAAVRRKLDQVQFDEQLDRLLYELDRIAAGAGLSETLQSLRTSTEKSLRFANSPTLREFSFPKIRSEWFDTFDLHAPEGVSLVDLAAYWLLLPAWPSMLFLTTLRVALASTNVMPRFLAHAFGFLIAFVVIVAANFAFFWLP